MLEREVPEGYLQECDKQGIHPEKYTKAMLNNGFALLGVPEEFGGTPCSSFTHLLVAEEIGKYGAPAYLFGVALQIDDILEFGSPEQQQIIMDIAKTGIPPFSLGFTEPGAGSDNMSITTATKKNGKVYLNGQKTFISWAQQAPYILLLTRDLDNPKPHDAISMWLVPSNTAGIKIVQQDKIAWKMGNTNEIFFDNVEIEESALVGKEGKGFYQLMKNFELERMIGCAFSLGFAQAAFDDSAKYANQRIQFKQPISNFQLIQQKFTDMQIKLGNMRNMVYKAAWDRDNGKSIRLSSALAKRYCGMASFEVIDEALQIMGGSGFCTENRISRLWRDVRVSRVGAGTDEVMVHIAGRMILKEYA
jgi:alkylation response protein AidB-like acyl-CoA dehydrogenase